MNRKGTNDEEYDKKKQKLPTLLELMNGITEDHTFDQTPSLFLEAANHIFSNGLFYITEKIPVRIIEVEFYMTSKIHNDPFSHKHSNQKKRGTLYFHQSSENKHSYKGGTYKGLDFTFGSKDFYGGILIRSLETKEGEFIFGPCNCVNYILRAVGCVSIKELVTEDLENKLSIFSESNNDKYVLDNDEKKFFLKFVERRKCEKADVKSFKWDELKVHKSSRVGLTLKKKDEMEDRKKFIVAPYRFFIFGNEMKKGKINAVCEVFKDEGNKYFKILKVVKVSKRSVDRYYEQYKIGKKKKISNFVGKKLSTDLLVQLHGCLHTQEKE